MAITVVRYTIHGSTHWGVLHGSKITPIPGDFVTTGELIECTSTSELAELSEPILDFTEVELLSPVTVNQQFICQGANYRQHMIDSGMNPDSKNYNMIFTKAGSCIAPAGTEVVRPEHVKFLDYEIELGLVLRRAVTEATTVTERNLHEFVAGAVIVNDYSARDVQLPQGQFYKGKSYRTFGPVGPYLVLLDAADIPALNDLRLQLTVNGEVRQQDSTANLVHKPAATLTELSGVVDLAAGDLLATGTPSGCALAAPKPALTKLVGLLPEARKWALFAKIQSQRPYLQPGDVVEASISSADRTIDLGVQRNLIVNGTRA
ncbi:fumarylacetoacetate hydrolase family protein [Nocardia gipuzkoensis]|uniref:fumarylacetoacetate hydrolase family protein n=1 Tax=Nocardia gipuzkoensis TaxID=2749991 RepID=UPI0015EEDE73|nr:fumarylacetoacetate hydrolase family protein [Nocardia gipuzkoensis]